MSFWKYFKFLKAIMKIIEVFSPKPEPQLVEKENGELVRRDRAPSVGEE